MTTVQDLTAPQKRALRELSKGPAKKLTPTLQRLMDLGLVACLTSDGQTRYNRTPEGVRLGMELFRIESMLYEVDSSGKKRRRKWK
jgi:hypothetical protein